MDHAKLDEGLERYFPPRQPEDLVTEDETEIESELDQVFINFSLFCGYTPRGDTDVPMSDFW